MAGAGALDIAAQFQSTHPVRGATMDKAAAAGNNEFQSTRPVWGATVQADDTEFLVRISIHAPRVGRDATRKHGCRTGRDFNPRAPCGARQKSRTFSWQGRQFQSTRPVWGATQHHDETLTYYIISIHAPRVGRDHYKYNLKLRPKNFNPRAPCGARR